MIDHLMRKLWKVYHRLCRDSGEELGGPAMGSDDTQKLHTAHIGCQEIYTILRNDVFSKNIATLALLSLGSAR